MALTNYVSATLVAVIARLLLFPQLGGAIVLWDIDLDAQANLTPAQLLLVWAGCAALLVVQSLASRLRLATHRQGPLEALWLVLTWEGARPAAAARGVRGPATDAPAPVSAP